MRSAAATHSAHIIARRLVRAKTRAYVDPIVGYLRVTNPGIWIFLAAVEVVLAGFFVWAAVETLETIEVATAIVENEMARVMPATADVLSAGMLLLGR